MIKLIDILNEIGDASMAVPYTHTDSGKSKYETVEKYEFNIGEDTYVVSMFISDIDIDLDIDIYDIDIDIDILCNSKIYISIERR